MLWTITHPSQDTSASKPTSVSAVFTLPADKIQSDLTGLQNNESVVVLLVVNHQAYRYDATVVQVREANAIPASTPGVNEKTVALSIRLAQTTTSTVIDFVTQLSDASAIYLLLTR